MPDSTLITYGLLRVMLNTKDYFIAWPAGSYDTGKYTGVWFASIFEILFYCVGAPLIHRTAEKKGNQQPLKNNFFMAHYISPVSYKQRIAQIMVLVIFIVAGVMFTRPAEAGNGPRPRHGKSAKNASVVHMNANHTCYKLHKKRTASAPKHVLLASRRTKAKPMAETDAPQRLAGAN